MSIVKSIATGSLVLDWIDWRAYGRFLRLLGNRPAVHLTYDRGILEIMTLSHEHESFDYILARLIDNLTEELSLTVKGGGSTTFRLRKRKRGLEPDACWWIANEPLVRGKRHIDLRTDPPPDLALEVDITHSSLDRLGIYAALGIPEVWRWEEMTLACYVCNAEGSYDLETTSRAVPGFQPRDLGHFLTVRLQMEENALVREFRKWVHEQVTAGRLKANT